MQFIPKLYRRKLNRPAADMLPFSKAVPLEARPLKNH